MILYIFLVLAFLSTIVVTVMIQQPWGPEGPVGAWLLLVIPCLLVAILVFALVAKGSLNFIPGGGLVRFIIAVGILITFSTVLFGIIDGHNSVIQGLLIVVPYLILAGCAAIIHQSGFPNPRLVQLVAAILLGGAALTGWGLAGKGVFL